MPSLLDLAVPGINALGTQAAGEEQRKALNASMNQLKTGYGNAMGTQQPIYNQALGQYQGLGNKYNAGDFAMPGATPFKLGADWQTDPGYQFSLKQGENAITDNASAMGSDHSGKTAKALMDYGIGRGAQEYGDIFNRQEGAANTAYNQNFMNQNQQFNEGQQLTNPLMPSSGNLMNLNTGLAQGLAGIEQQKGAINGQLAAGPFGAASGTLGILGQPGQSTGQNGAALDPSMIQQLMTMLGGG